MASEYSYIASAMILYSELAHSAIFTHGGGLGFDPTRVWQDLMSLLGG